MSDLKHEIIVVTDGNQFTELMDELGLDIAGKQDYPAAIEAGRASVAFGLIDGKPISWGAARHIGVHPRQRRVRSVLSQELPYDIERTTFIHSMLTPDEQNRGRGIGRGILTAFEGVVIQRSDLEPVTTLTVRHTNPAVRLYERGGYQDINDQEGRRRIFRITVPGYDTPAPQRERSLIMYKDLSNPS